MQIQLNEGESAEYEFKKAFYKLNFDYMWHLDLQKIEQEHYMVMGGIFQHTRLVGPDNSGVLSVDPLSLPKKQQEYSYEVDMAFVKEASPELLMLLGQKFIVKFGIYPTNLAIKT